MEVVSVKVRWRRFGHEAVAGGRPGRCVPGPGRFSPKILTRAEGNPFFVEEVIRMLIERGDLAQYAAWGWDDAAGAFDRVRLPARSVTDDDLGPIDLALSEHIGRPMTGGFDPVGIVVMVLLWQRAGRVARRPSDGRPREADAV